MNKFLVFAIGSIALMSTALAADVDEVLVSIQTVMQSAITAAGAENKPVDFEAVRAEQQRIAKEALKGFSMETLNPAVAVRWATVAKIAGDYKLGIKLYEVYIGSGVLGTELFMAKMGLGQLQGLAGDIAGMVETAKTITPENLQQAGQYTSFVVWDAVPALIAANDLRAARTLLERAERMLEGQSDTFGKASDPEKTARARLANPYRVLIVEGTVDVLKAEGKRDEAIALLQAAASDETLDASTRSSLNAKIAQAKMIGAEAPEIQVQHVLGEFTSLEALREKVVLVDFFAHWCGPCVASIPALRDLNSEFGERGFQIVHVTRTYGFFGRERDISVEAEIEKMREFKKRHELTWPVVFTSGGTFAAYGVRGIPHLALVDRSGKVRYIKVGFNPAMVPGLKREIEKLLTERSD